KSDLTRGHVAVTGPGWQATKLIDVAAELLPTARKPLASRTRVRVHLGTAEVLARAVQTRAIGPGQRGMARLMLETPVVARGGDRFVLRSFSPVTTIGGGVVLDPFSPPHTRLRRRRLSLEQGPAGRLGVLAVEAGLMGLGTDSLAVRLGVSTGGGTAVIAGAGGVAPSARRAGHRCQRKARAAPRRCALAGTHRGRARARVSRLSRARPPVALRPQRHRGADRCRALRGERCAGRVPRRPRGRARR